MAKGKQKKMKRRKRPKTDEEYRLALEELNEKTDRLEAENKILRKFHDFIDQETKENKQR